MVHDASRIRALNYRVIKKLLLGTAKGRGYGNGEMVRNEEMGNIYIPLDALLSPSILECTSTSPERFQLAGRDGSDGGK